jgi:hypothetical protein
MPGRFDNLNELSGVLGRANKPADVETAQNGEKPIFFCYLSEFGLVDKPAAAVACA